MTDSAAPAWNIWVYESKATPREVAILTDPHLPTNRVYFAGMAHLFPRWQEV